MYENTGCSWNEPITPFTVGHLKNCYDSSTWALRGLGVRVDIASNTSCRAPGNYFFKCGKKYKNLLLHSIYVFSFVMTVTFIITVCNRNMCGIWVMPFIVL
jgi:hypothetical protein